MDIADRLANFFKHEANLLIGKLPVLVHVLEQRPVRRVLKDQVNDGPFDNLRVESNNIFMTKRGLDTDLLFDVLQFPFLQLPSIDLVTFTDFKAYLILLTLCSTRDTLEE